LRKIDANWLENEVWSNVAKALSDSDALRKTVDDAVTKLEKRRWELEAASQPIERQLQKVNNRIRNLVQALGRAENVLAESDLEDFEGQLEHLRKQKADLEARKASLNPEHQIEVSRLENYITWVKKLLDQGGLVVEPDGIWAYAFGEAGGLIAAENFGPGLDVEATVKKYTGPRQPAVCEVARGDGGVDLAIKVNVWSFMHPKESRIQMMRAILQKFDVVPYAFPDRVEIRGMIPTEIIKLPVDGRRANGGRKISSAY
jgi:hypothetical protein